MEPSEIIFLDGPPEPSTWDDTPSLATLTIAIDGPDGSYVDFHADPNTGLVSIEADPELGVSLSLEALDWGLISLLLSRQASR